MLGGASLQALALSSVSRGPALLLLLFTETQLGDGRSCTARERPGAGRSGRFGGWRWRLALSLAGNEHGCEQVCDHFEPPSMRFTH
jgi:hypothetical protein